MADSWQIRTHGICHVFPDNLGDMQKLADLAKFPPFTWVVYAKRPFGGATSGAQVSGELHAPRSQLDSTIDSASIRPSNLPLERLCAWGRLRSMTIAPGEFLRRFLLHLLPWDFMKIRHCGFMANRFHGSKFALLRDLLDVPAMLTGAPLHR